MRDFVFHLPGSWLGPLGSGMLPFYERLIAGLEERGMTVRRVTLDRETVAAEIAADAAFHVVNHGRVRHPRCLNAGVAYVYPFWNMDPAGIRAFSSIGEMAFDPGSVDGAAARVFFRRLRKRLVGGRQSRYPQPEARTELPEGAVAVFLQSDAHRVVGETCHLTQAEMLETVLATVDGPVVVKPHPRDDGVAVRDQLAALSARHGKLQVTEANIHDILGVAGRVVTINSAVGIEAYLHRVPVILCGQADFHHVAQTARDAEALARLLQSPPGKRAYDKFIYWYFGLQCLSTTEAGLVDRFLARVEANLRGAER